MKSQYGKVCAFSFLLIAASMWIGVDRAFAANGAGGPSKLLPVPAGKSTSSGHTAEQTPAPAATMVENGTAEEGSSICDDSNGADFCGAQLCSPPGRFWLRADYLMWWTSGQNLPPLVTTSPQGTSRDQAGVLPNATILSGNETVNADGHSGIRGTLGMYLDACHVWGVEFDYYNIGERDNTFAQSSTGNPILARPFFNVETNQSASQLVAFPGVVEGTVTTEARDYFQSVGMDFSYNLCASECGDSCGESCGESCGDMNCGRWCAPLLFCCRTDLLVGFRYFNLSDRVGIHETLRDVDHASPAINTMFDIVDSFSSRNDFYGSEIGLRTKIHRGRWSLDLMSKVAVGNNHETVTINGQTTVTAPSQPTQTFGSGILAGPSNTGTFQRNVFTMIPQLGAEVGCQVTCHLRAFLGYNIMYWGAVSRAGDQIDLNVDPRNFPPATAGALPFPAFAGKTDSFWAQGINVGGEFRF